VRQLFTTPATSLTVPRVALRVRAPVAEAVELVEWPEIAHPEEVELEDPPRPETAAVP
jgi:hypothetical protein